MATTLDRTWYNTLVDNSGGAIPDGSIWDKADVDSLMDTVDAMIAADIVFGGAVTTNGQIVFPATQNPSADANTLDDYEENTGTVGLSSAGGGSATYTEQTARWRKWGSCCKVYLTITINVDSFTAGNLSITGLPYPAAATNAGGGSAKKWTSMSTSTTSAIHAVVDDGATTATLYIVTTGAATTANLAASDVGNGTSIEMLIEYMTAS